MSLEFDLFFNYYSMVIFAFTIFFHIRSNFLINVFCILNLLLNTTEHID